MSAGYAERLKKYPYKGLCGLPEIMDTNRVVQYKIKKLKDYMEQANTIVILTGAGISTSVGIPDFRGPHGIWTIEQDKNKKQKKQEQVRNQANKQQQSIKKQKNIDGNKCIPLSKQNDIDDNKYGDESNQIKKDEEEETDDDQQFLDGVVDDVFVGHNSSSSQYNTNATEIDRGKLIIITTTDDTNATINISPNKTTSKKRKSTSTTTSTTNGDDNHNDNEINVKDDISKRTSETKDDFVISTVVTVTSSNCQSSIINETTTPTPTPTNSHLGKNQLMKKDLKTTTTTTTTSTTDTNTIGSRIVKSETSQHQQEREQKQKQQQQQQQQQPATTTTKTTADPDVIESGGQQQQQQQPLLEPCSSSSRSRQDDDFASFIPSLTHRAITYLVHKVHMVQHVITQNVDGLHQRCGLSRHHLSVLHGCAFTEQCSNINCCMEYYRDYDVRGMSKQQTGRFCDTCSFPLIDTLLDWDDPLPEFDYERSIQICKKADLIICCGTSLRIDPVGDLPLYGKKYIIINLQVTPKDEQATLIIRGKIDDIMKQLMKEFGYTDWEKEEFRMENTTTTTTTTTTDDKDDFNNNTNNNVTKIERLWKYQSIEQQQQIWDIHAKKRIRKKQCII